MGRCDSFSHFFSTLTRGTGQVEWDSVVSPALCGSLRTFFLTAVLPLQVGGIKPGCFKIGNTGGMLDNILASKLYRPGSVAYVSRSGGMSNELNNIISRTTDGVYEGVAIGGDR